MHRARGRLATWRGAKISVPSRHRHQPGEHRALPIAVSAVCGGRQRELLLASRQCRACRARREPVPGCCWAVDHEGVFVGGGRVRGWTSDARLREQPAENEADALLSGRIDSTVRKTGQLADQARADQVIALVRGLIELQHLRLSAGWQRCGPHRPADRRGTLLSAQAFALQCPREQGRGGRRRHSGARPAPCLGAGRQFADSHRVHIEHGDEVVHEGVSGKAEERRPVEGAAQLRIGDADQHGPHR